MVGRSEEERARLKGQGGRSEEERASSDLQYVDEKNLLSSDPFLHPMTLIRILVLEGNRGPLRIDRRDGRATRREEERS